MERLTEKQKHILQTKLCDMKRRCNNPKDKFYKDYGGRGIRVCKEWKNSYSVFREWSFENGYDENASFGKCTIDRINNNGNYEPSNCRWVDMKVQANNKGGADMRKGGSDE